MPTAKKRPSRKTVGEAPPTEESSTITLTPRDTELLQRCLGQNPTAAAQSTATRIAAGIELPKGQKRARFAQVKGPRGGKFDCGLSPFNAYLKQPVPGGARWVIEVGQSRKVLGFYCLLRGSVLLAPFDSHGEAGALGRLTYRRIRALATDLGSRHQGLGRQLCLHAMGEAASETGDDSPLLLIADAISQRSVHFYEQFGFIPFPDQPQLLFLPLGWLQESSVRQTG